MKKTNIAILGASSHIGKGLIYNFLQDERYNLQLYTRSSEKVSRFVGSVGEKLGNTKIYSGYREFLKLPHDVIINCVGVGTLNKVENNYSSYFTVTEKFDNLAISYLLNRCTSTLYISFSSGAIYGRDFFTPANKCTVNHLAVNHIEKQDYYAITRLNAEAKHRSFEKLNIVDLRIFSYFSRFIDLQDNYFLCEILNCVLNNKVLDTDDTNIVRDYLHPKDLHTMINKCIDIGKINGAFDVYSTKPVEKKEILHYYASRCGLKYRINKLTKHESPTGPKNTYCSNYKKAKQIGYKPNFSSIDTIRDESKYLLNKN